MLIYFMPGTMLGTQEKLKLCNTWARRAKSSQEGAQERKHIFQVVCVITKWHRLTELDFKDREVALLAGGITEN